MKIHGKTILEQDLGESRYREEKSFNKYGMLRKFGKT